MCDETQHQSASGDFDRSHILNMPRNLCTSLDRSSGHGLSEAGNCSPGSLACPSETGEPCSGSSRELASTKDSLSSSTVGTNSSLALEEDERNGMRRRTLSSSQRATDAMPGTLVGASGAIAQSEHPSMQSFRRDDCTRVVKIPASQLAEVPLSGPSTTGRRTMDDGRAWLIRSHRKASTRTVVRLE